MESFFDRIKPAAAFAGEVLAETLWPTRCAICDELGKVLCDRCAAKLPYLDWWRACRRCGAAYGLVQCPACNPVAMGLIGRDDFPFTACASATMFSGTTGRVVRVFKDQGEQRLARDIARAMARAVPPDWAFDRIAFVPVSEEAFRRRGYDHGALMAEALEAELGVAAIEALGRPKTRDQRTLTGLQRVRNLAGQFAGRPEPCSGKRLLLVDDVFTTGATMCAATDALLAAGAREVRCLTFARV